jgi:hypothetical protein
LSPDEAMKITRRLVALLALLALCAGVVLAQRTAREADTTEAPAWPVDPHFKKDAFTFARVKYSVGRHGLGRSGQDRWSIDFPDCDLNFSFRLQQVTSIKVDPEGLVVELTGKELFNQPFLYLIEPGRLDLSDQEAEAVRRYLESGGFLMLDDFWGDEEWDNLMEEMKRVFPDREPVELPVEHPIFNGVFPLKERPQVPHIDTAMAEQYTGRRWGPRRRGSIQEADYRAILDDKGRIMVLFCHNTDLGDGWEREGENEYYFREFSEKKAYPLGINIVFYAMTH